MNSIPQLLVTGASGFIGKALTIEAKKRGLNVRAATRSCSVYPDEIECIGVGEINGTTDWRNALQGCDVVIHLAARAHIVDESSHNSLINFRNVNVAGTLNFARQAADEGVKRFIFISSIGVNGAETFTTPFGVLDEPAPHSMYALSKYEAELGLQVLASETRIEVVVIRPPLVYGPDAPGNFGVLVRWLKRGLPLPLGAITQNRRSLVALDNLVDLILTCAQHPMAANQTFLVSDGEDLSTTELLKRIGNAMKQPARLLPVPAGLLALAANSLGKKRISQSLLGSLQVDISNTRKTLNWEPPITVDDGLRRAVMERI